MQVKYASRHALYPVPNVMDSAVVIVAARPDKDALCAVGRTGDDALRTVAARMGVVALRTVVVVAADRAVVARDMFVLLLPREFVALRDTVFFVVRAGVLRWVVVRTVFCVVRSMVLSSRTAALAKPTLKISASVKFRPFLILLIYVMISKMPQVGKQIIEKITKKIPQNLWGCY